MRRLVLRPGVIHFSARNNVLTGRLVIRRRIFKRSLHLH